MQTYYDGATRTWLTRQADGTTRPATSAEALDAVSRGAQAPPGTPMPGGTSPTPALNPAPPADPYPLQRNQQPSVILGGVTYNWNAKTGKYEDAQGRASGDVVGPPPDKPSPPAIPTGWGTGYAGQPPPSGWGTGFTGGTPRAESPFANITGQQQAYYQVNPDLANQLLRQWLAPNATSAEAQYIDSRMPDMQKQYAIFTGQKGNEGVQYTDWLKDNFGQLPTGFANQSATQRGENPVAFGGGFAGRFTG